MIKELLNSKFKKDLAFSYFIQVITIVFGFIQLFLINSYFGVEVFGQLSIIMSTAGIFSALLTARSSETITKFFTREMINQNLENAKFILAIGFCIDIITAFLMVGLTYLLSDFIAQTFLKEVEFGSGVFLYSFVIFFGFLRGTVFGYFQSKEMFFLINTISVFESFIKIIALTFIIFALQDTSLYQIIMTLIVASLLSFVYAFLVFIKNYKIEFKDTIFSYNKNILKEYWSFNIKTFASSSLKAGNSNVDALLIGFFLSAYIAGIYQTIKKVLSPIGLVVSPFSILVYPKLIHFFEQNQKDKFKNIILKISLYILLIGVGYIFIIYILIDNIFSMMNVEFSTDNHTVYILLAILTIVNSLLWWTRVFSNVVNPNYSLYMNIFATSFQLTVTVYLTYLFGINGLISSIIFMNLLIGFYWLRKVQSYVRKTIYIY